jgi:hypothetical protein
MAVAREVTVRKREGRKRPKTTIFNTSINSLFSW